MATLPPMAMCFTLKVPPLLAKVSYSLAGVARVVTMRPYISVRGGILILLTGLNGRRSIRQKIPFPALMPKGIRTPLVMRLQRPNCRQHVLLTVSRLMVLKILS
ncbi:Uncharacterised protein [Escherichia coli]|nr:Uncharacterised protein [Escherichia coli]